MTLSRGARTQQTRSRVKWQSVSTAVLRRLHTAFNFARQTPVQRTFVGDPVSNDVMNSIRLSVAASLTAIASVLAGCAVYPAYPIGSVGGYAAPYSAYGQTSPLLVTPGAAYYGNPYDGYSGGYGGYSGGYGGYIGGYSGGYGSAYGGYYGGYPQSYYRPPGSYRYYYGDQNRRPYHDGARNHTGPRTRSDATPAAPPGNTAPSRGPGSHRDRD